MMFLVFEFRSSGMSQSPEVSDVSSGMPPVVSGGKPFASLQAVMHAPAASADGAVVEHRHGVWRSHRMCWMFLRNGGCSQPADDRASGSDNPHKELTTVDLDVHIEAFGPVPGPAFPSGESESSGGPEPGTLSSSSLVENLREAT